MLFSSPANSTGRAARKKGERRGEREGEKRRSLPKRLWRSEGELVGAWSGSGGRKHLLFSITHQSLQPSQPLPYCVNNHTHTSFSHKHNYTLTYTHTHLQWVLHTPTPLGLNMRHKYAPEHVCFCTHMHHARAQTPSFWSPCCSFLGHH